MAPRQHLPPRRYGWTQKVRIGGLKIYLTINEFPDGTPGEIFVVAAKTGELVQAMLSGWAMNFSHLLQMGVALGDLYRSFHHAKFDPSGPVTDDPDVRMATSIFDWIVKHLAENYKEGALKLEEKVCNYKHAALPRVVDVDWDGKPIQTGNGDGVDSNPAHVSPERGLLERFAQDMADEHQCPFLVIMEPPDKLNGKPLSETATIPYATAEHQASPEEKKAAVRRVLPKEKAS
jgi:hypothetical protein